MNHKPSIIVVGIGNTLRGDDGIGWYAVDQLADAINNKDIEFLKCRELMPEISEKISKAKYVLFIDADSESVNGQVNETYITPIESYPSLETHQLDPAGLLAFSTALYGNTPKAVMLTTRGESFEYGEKLSEAVREAAQSLISRAHAKLNEWCQNLQPKSCSF